MLNYQLLFFSTKFFIIFFIILKCHKLGKQKPTNQKKPQSIKKNQSTLTPAQKNKLKTENEPLKSAKEKQLLGMDSILIRN